MISQEDKERVRRETDIVAVVSETVNLKQRGRDFWGLCPFHQEKSPSFKVNPDTGLWHCFGCGEGGDVFAYIQRRDHLEFPDAIRILADRAGIELTEEASYTRGPKKSRLLELLDSAARYFHTMLMRSKTAGAAEARSYLSSRGFGSELCKRWNLGYAPGHGDLCRRLLRMGFLKDEIIAADLGVERSGRLEDRFFERVMFPICDDTGRCIAFGGRIIGSNPRAAKYLNSKDTPVFHKGSRLFAFDRAKSSITATGQAIVCEGYTDVIAMHEAGFTNAVAALGTAFRQEHIALIQRQRARRIICLFDGDEAGQRAAERSVGFVETSDAELLCVVLPEGEDPMEFLQKHSAQDMAAELSRARPLIDFVFDRRLQGLDLSSPGKRVHALHEMAGLLSPLKHSVLLDEYVVKLAQKLGTDVKKTKDTLIGTMSTNSSAVSYAQKNTEASYQKSFGGASAVAFAQDTNDSFAYVLSPAARTQLAAEKKLMSAMLYSPDSFKVYKDRISQIDWVDTRIGAIVGVFLAAPSQASPQDLVIQASEAVEEAPELLSGAETFEERGEILSSSADIIIDSLEMSCALRRIDEIRARVDGGVDDAREHELFEEAAQLAGHVNELQKRISHVSQASKVSKR